MSINDFIGQKSNSSQIQNSLDFGLTSGNSFANPLNTVPPGPSSSDFSTMQILFQTNSLGQSNLGAQNQINFATAPQSQPANLNLAPSVPSNAVNTGN
jgi:hypothetical protein